MMEWQLNFELVPSVVAAAHRLSPGMQITETQRRKIDWWRGQSLSPSALDRLGESFPRRKRIKVFGAEFEDFGNLQTIGVSVLRENDKITGIYVRVDFRILSEEIALLVWNFAESVGCLLIGEEHKILDPVFLVLAARNKGDLPGQIN